MTIFSNTEIKLDFLDRIRAAFGKTIHLYLEIETSTETEVISSISTCSVDPIFPRSGKGEGLLQTNQPAP